MKIAVVGAHPDDPEIGCGGTMARYAERGDDVVMIYVTDGTAGAWGGDRKKLSRIRMREGRAAAALIGVELVGLGLPDADLVNSLENRRCLVEALRRVRPDVIITHAPFDQNADHRVTSELVNDANLQAVVRKVKTGSDPLPGMVPIYYMEPYLGVGFVPTEYVDITSSFETKRRLLACHVSQIGYLKKTDPAVEGSFPAGWIETAARFRGFQCQVKYAEGFRLCLIGGGLRPRRLLP